MDKATTCADHDSLNSFSTLVKMDYCSTIVLKVPFKVHYDIFLIP